MGTYSVSHHRKLDQTLTVDEFWLLPNVKPPWRNWLARSAVNRKVGGSSPPGGDLFLIITFYMEVTMNVPWQSPIQVLTRLNVVSG